ncbi:MAG: hypothetical protein J6Y32_01410 [Bacteroidales bacterium]|nr:hypothetical protein [Bacteroidales bacterium]
MKRLLKYLLVLFVLVLTGVAAALTAGVAEAARSHVGCKHVCIENESPEGARFLPDEQVKAELEQHFGHLYGVPLGQLDLHAIETLLDEKSAVLKSEVYVSYPDSSLHVGIRERIPILRFQPAGGQAFYCDREGKLFPLQKNYSARVPIVDGTLPIDCWWNLTPKGAQWLEGMCSLADFLHTERKWGDRCCQIHVSRSGAVGLVFEPWEEFFIIGDCRNLEAKFQKIEQYIFSVRPQADGKKYKSVNVRFEGQIICK